ncbi:uncharacterized protein LOC144938025 [Lampetra fluviatilis]
MALPLQSSPPMVNGSAITVVATDGRTLPPPPPPTADEAVVKERGEVSVQRCADDPLRSGRVVEELSESVGRHCLLISRQTPLCENERGPSLNTKLPSQPSRLRTRPRLPVLAQSRAECGTEGAAKAASALEAAREDGGGGDSSSRRNTANEKRRRERINESCNELQRLLPACRGLRSDRICILEMATDLIAYTKDILPAETLCQALSPATPPGSGELPWAATPRSYSAPPRRPAAASQDRRADSGKPSAKQEEEEGS